MLSIRLENTLPILLGIKITIAMGHFDMSFWFVVFDVRFFQTSVIQKWVSFQKSVFFARYIFSFMKQTYFMILINDKVYHKFQI